METNRKKKCSPDMKGIPEDVYEFIVQSKIYDKLEDLAMKEKLGLTDVHVKDMIKKVIYGINPVDPYGPSSSGCAETPKEPKLTRAKKKELYQKQQTIKFTNFSEMTHTSVPQLDQHNQILARSDATALVSAVFPEDDDDDEYNPEHDEQIMSDEESILSLLGSPSSTPMRSVNSKRQMSHNYADSTPGSVILSSSLSSQKKAKLIMTENNGMVKRALNFSEENTSVISNRTRSKYPMTDTPLEYLEMSFIPPDITADMYETEIDDDEWKQFILDFVQPEAVATKEHHDDEQGDPEYDLLADAEIETPTLDELREELRGDPGVRISKREVNELVMESLELSLERDNMFNNNNFFTNNENYLWNLDIEQQLEQPTQILNELIETQEETNAEPIVVTYLLHEFSKEQMDILQSQLRLHVQLLTQSIFMTCYDQRIGYVEDGCKKMLNEIASASKMNSLNRTSLFETSNLASALETVAKYDMKREAYLRERKDKEDIRVVKRCMRVFLPPFPSMFEEIFLESSAFPYVRYLPYGLFWVCFHGKRKGFLRSEYYLMASGFSEILTNTKVFDIQETMKYQKCFHQDLLNICSSLIKTFGISADNVGLCNHLKRILTKLYLDKDQNEIDAEDKIYPFVQYVKTGNPNLPPAKVEPLPKCVPFVLKDMSPCDLKVTMLSNLNDVAVCPLKNVSKKFLPKYFFKMVNRYQTEMKKEMKAATPVKHISKKNIVIIQEGQMTKIVLPSDGSIVIENAQPVPNVDVMSNNEESRLVASVGQVPLQSGFPYITPKSKPVNTVVPTPVTNVITFSQSNPTNCVETNTVYRPCNVALPISNQHVYADSAFYPNNHNSCLPNNSINISPQKFLPNISFSPLKTTYGNFDSATLDLSQANKSSTFNNNCSTDPCHVESYSNNNSIYLTGENAGASDSICVQQASTSLQFDMPFLMATPKKTDKVSVVIRPHIDSSQKKDNSNEDNNIQASSLENSNAYHATSSVKKNHQFHNSSKSSCSKNSESVDNRATEIRGKKRKKSKGDITKSSLKKGNDESRHINEYNKLDNKNEKVKIKLNKNTKISKRKNNLTEKGKKKPVKEDRNEEPGQEEIVDKEKTNDDYLNNEDNDDDSSFEMMFFSKAKSVLGNNFEEFLLIFNSFAREKRSPRYVYPKIRKIFQRHPDLQIEFLVFFDSEQAKKVGKTTEHRIVMCSKHLYNKRATPELINKTEVRETVKAALSLQNKKTPDQLVHLLKPILSLPPSVLENLT